jgi:hypothetical protein
MKTIQTKNEFVEEFMKSRYLEDKIKFEKNPKNKGKTSTFGTTREGRSLLTQQALAMYQLYVVAATLPETKISEDTPLRSDSPSYSLIDYIKIRVPNVTNATLFNILTNNGIPVDINECITPEFELAVIKFGQMIQLEKEHDAHTGKKLEYCAQALINYFNFFKNNATAPQFIQAVVVTMTRKANLTLSPAHTPTETFSHYVNIVRANLS